VASWVDTPRDRGFMPFYSLQALFFFWAALRACVCVCVCVFVSVSVSVSVRFCVYVCVRFLPFCLLQASVLCLFKSMRVIWP
jgi:hypothetical protein